MRLNKHGIYGILNMHGNMHWSAHDGWRPPNIYASSLDYIGRSLGVRWTLVQRGPKRERRRCVSMTTFEIISIIIGILSLLIAFGSLIVAFLAFLDKRNKKK